MMLFSIFINFNTKQRLLSSSFYYHDLKVNAGQIFTFTTQ